MWPLHRHTKFSTCLNNGMGLWPPPTSLSTSSKAWLTDHLLSWEPGAPTLPLLPHNWSPRLVMFALSMSLEHPTPAILRTHCLSSPSCLEKTVPGLVSLAHVSLLSIFLGTLFKLNPSLIVPGLKSPYLLNTLLNAEQCG